MYAFQFERAADAKAAVAKLKADPDASSWPAARVCWPR